MDKMVYTRRSHGRLYPNWRLPSLPQFADVQKAFNKALERTIERNLSTMLFENSKQKILFYPLPNESTILTLILSTSSLFTMPNRVTDQEGGSIVSRSISESVKENSVTVLPLIGSELSGANGPPSPHSAIADMTTKVKRKTTSTDSTRTPSVTVEKDATLTQGAHLTRHLHLDAASHILKAGYLEIQIEYIAGACHTSNEEHSKSRSFNVKWLTEEEVERLNEDESAAIIDAEMLDTKHEQTFQNPTCLYIGVRGAVVRVEFPKSLRQHEKA